MKWFSLFKKLSLLSMVSMAFAVWVPAKVHAASPVDGTMVKVTAPNDESAVYFANTAVKSGAEFMFSPPDNISFDVDPANSRIIMTFKNGYAYRESAFTFDLVFSGGDLDKILTVTKNTSATTSTYPGTATVVGDKKIRFTLNAVGSTALSNGVIVWNFTSIAFATKPTSIQLGRGLTNGVGAVFSVSIPPVGGTNTSGSVAGWLKGFADTIRFTVTDGGSASSSIKINGAAYVSGTDYVVQTALSSLQVTVTTTESGKSPAVRSFTIPVQPITPLAPIAPVQNDAANTFGWTYALLFDSLADYEYSLDNGLTWADATANPQTIPDENYAVGRVQVRVKADTTIGRPAGMVLVSTAAYTVTPPPPEAPTAPAVHDGLNTFGWSYVPGFGSPTDYEYSLDEGDNWLDVSANPQPVPDQAYAAGEVQVRVKADASNGRPAGAVLASAAAFTVTPPAPEAPTGAEQHDGLNSFGWTNVSGFDFATDYEYSLDGGATWTPAGTNPVLIPDQAYAIGQVRVRVKRDETNGRPPSAALHSTAAYTVAPPAPAAPTEPVVHDGLNTFGWTNVPGFDHPEHYEYTLDAGNSWHEVEDNPQSIPDEDFADGQVQVRVKKDETNGRPAGAALASTVAFTETPPAPAAPTGPIVHDGVNTFGWSYVPGFETPADYEISLDGGDNWNPVIANPQPVPDQAYAAGQVQVRVKADASNARPAGAALTSTVAFTETPPAPDAPTGAVVHDGLNTFGWTNVSGFEAPANYEISLDGGITWTGAASNPQSVPDQNYAIGQVQVRVKWDETNGRPAGAALASTAAYTVTPPAPAAPTGPVVHDGLNTIGWSHVAGFEGLEHYEYSLDGGATWTGVASNPQPVPDEAFAVGQVQVRVKADASNGRPAGAAMLSTAVYTVTPPAPEAPTGAIVHDGLNTFGWTNVEGFGNPADYEISLDRGATWTVASANPQPVPDEAYDPGAVQVRVKADASNARPAGAVLASAAVFTVTPPAPEAPTAPVVHDGLNTFGWMNVAGFDNPSDYEYSLNGGAVWTEAVSNPQPVPDQAYAVGQVQVRVKRDESNGRPAGAALASTAAYTVTPPAPVAPSDPVENDGLNTFGWTNVEGFDEDNDYEYSLDAGATWKDVLSNPQLIPDGAFAAGAVHVRVKADASNGRPAGAALVSSKVYTVTQIPVFNEYWTINGNPAGFLNAVTTTSNGRQTTMVKLESDKLDKLLQSAGNRPVVSIAVNRTSASSVIGELTGAMAGAMADKGAAIELSTAHGSFKLPAAGFQLEDLASRLGAGANLKDLNIRIGVSSLSANDAKDAEASIAKLGASMLTQPVQFGISAVYGKTEIDVGRLSQFVERSVPLPKGIKPDQAITGVIVASDGSIRHVPTRIVEKDGGYYAVMSGMDNGVFTLVQYNAAFNDINRHWAEKAILDMGSRLVVGGTGNGQFQPNREITRAEFASILVRALGLATDAQVPFTDVGQSAWFKTDVGTAYDYGLIFGISAEAFVPDLIITREQAMTMLARAMGLAGMQYAGLSRETADQLLEAFGDGSTVSGYAKVGVAACVEAGIIQGSERGLAPKQNITRAEVAVIVKRLLEKAALI